jgi:hypothetical protein
MLPGHGGAAKDNYMNQITCEICEGEEYEPDSVEDFESILETGRCVACFNEWGFEWPDRI